MLVWYLNRPRSGLLDSQNAAKGLHLLMVNGTNKIGKQRVSFSRCQQVKARVELNHNT
jgi:hypothetical protein